MSLRFRPVYVFPVILIQAFVRDRRSFSFEVCVQVTDRLTKDRNRFRLIFSTGFTTIRRDPLHLQVPLIKCPRDKWTNLFANLKELMGDVEFSIEGIRIEPSCQIRKIVQIRNSPCPGKFSVLPARIAYHQTTPVQDYVVFNTTSISESTTTAKQRPRQARTKLASGSSSKCHPEANLPSSSTRKREANFPYPGTVSSCLSGIAETRAPIDRSRSILEEAYSFIRGIKRSSNPVVESAERAKYALSSQVISPSFAELSINEKPSFSAESLCVDKVLPEIPALYCSEFDRSPGGSDTESMTLYADFPRNISLSLDLRIASAFDAVQRRLRTEHSTPDWEKENQC